MIHFSKFHGTLTLLITKTNYKNGCDYFEVKYYRQHALTNLVRFCKPGFTKTDAILQNLKVNRLPVPQDLRSRAEKDPYYSAQRRGCHTSQQCSLSPASLMFVLFPFVWIMFTYFSYDFEISSDKFKINSTT